MSAGPVVVGGSNFDLVVQVLEEITLDGSSHSGRLHLRPVNQAAYLNVAHFPFPTNLFNPRQRARKLSPIIFLKKQIWKVEVVRDSSTGTIVSHCSGSGQIRKLYFGLRIHTLSRQINKRDNITNVDDNFFTISSQKITDSGSRIPNEIRDTGTYDPVYLVTFFVNIKR